VYKRQTTENPLDPVAGDGLGDLDNTNMTVDFGFVEPAEFGNRVWFDDNEDGLQDSGELGVPGVVITLFEFTPTGSIQIGTDTTDADGLYLFEELPPNRQYYAVFSNLPADYEYTDAQAGPNDMIDSDPNRLTGKTSPTLLSPAEEDTTWDAGIFLPKAEIGDYVWEDLDEDGYQEVGEPPIAGVRVVLYNAAGDSLDQTFTDAMGRYEFTELDPGNYYVDFAELPAGYEDYVASPQNNHPNDQADSDADPVTGLTSPTRLDPYESDPSWDAGFYIPRASLGDFVWYDTNQDGVQDPNEVGVPGVKVILYDDMGNKLDSTITGPTGRYLFEDLTPDTYQVQFTDLPTDYSLSPEDGGCYQ